MKRTMPLRVAHVVGGTRTGSTRVVLNLIANADRAHVTSAVCFFSIAPADPEVIAAVAATGTPWREVIKGSRYELGAFDRLVGALRALEPEVVVVHGFGTYSYGALAARAAGARSVVRVEHSPELYGPHYVLVSAMTAAFVDSTILVSGHLNGYLRERGIVVPRPEVVPNGIPLEQFLSITRPPFSDQTARPTVTMVARLDVAKDHATLLAAASLLKERGRPIALRLAGDGPLRDSLEAEAQRRDLDVAFLGHVRDLSSLYAESDVVVLSTHYEGMPLALAEGMAAGRPVVASAIAAVSEMIDDGVHGFAVPPRDPVALADAIATLIADPARAQAMGLAGRAHAQARHALLPSVRAFEAHLFRTSARVGRADFV